MIALILMPMCNVNVILYIHISVCTNTITLREDHSSGNESDLLCLENTKPDKP